MNVFRFWIVVAGVALAACGQKGPLYLPSEVAAEPPDSQVQDKKDRSAPVPPQPLPSSP